MSLLWRLLQQIASWLDECPQVRVEHVPPAAKQEQIKGQRNLLELEVRFLCTRPLFRQHFSGCIRQSAWNLDWGLISGELLPSELSSQSTLGFQGFIPLGTSIHKAHNTHWYWTAALHSYKCGRVRMAITQTCHYKCIYFKGSQRFWPITAAWHQLYKLCGAQSSE